MDNSVRFSNLLEDIRHFVWLVAAGVSVLRSLTGDKLTGQLCATVARLIGSIDALAERSRSVIVVTIHRARPRDESTGRSVLSSDVQS